MARLIIFNLFPLLFSSQLSAIQKEVVVIGTIHGDHNRFPLYNLETLRIAVEHISPDLLIIEEDPKSFAEKWYEMLPEEEYLQKRPIEIRKVLMPYALKKGVKVIPVDDRQEYDERSKPLDAKLNVDLKDPVNKHSVELLLKSYESLFVDEYLTKTIYDFQSDSFMSVIDQYQELSRGNPLTKESEALSDRRQTQIDKNIIRTLDQENYKRALIVYGVTHRPSIIRAIMKSNSAKIVDLHQAMKPRIDGYFERTHSLMLGK